MYVPRASQGFHLPRFNIPLIPPLAVVIVVIAWAVLSVSPIGHEPAGVQPTATNVHSVAYFDHADGRDILMVRRAVSGAAPLPIVSFSRFLNFRARGGASPSGDTVAVLSVGERATSAAALTLVDLRSGEARVVPGGFGYLSPLAWSPDGERLGVLGHSASQGAPVLVEVDVTSASIVSASRFDSAIDLAPVGFTAASRRMLTVVVDPGGSSLWSVQAGDAVRIAELSPGLTRDWVLSPDGARLAFVERVGVGGRRYFGRVLMLASGTVQRAPGEEGLLGAAWQPGVAAPGFGGPGGSLRLAHQPSDGYLVPRAWSPDGHTLVAAVFSSAAAGEEPVIQLINTDGWRMPLGNENATFVGWVQDRE